MATIQEDGSACVVGSPVRRHATSVGIGAKPEGNVSGLECMKGSKVNFKAPLSRITAVVIRGAIHAEADLCLFQSKAQHLSLIFSVPSVVDHVNGEHAQSEFEAHAARHVYLLELRVVVKIPSKHLMVGRSEAQRAVLRGSAGAGGSTRCRCAVSRSSVAAETTPPTEDRGKSAANLGATLWCRGCCRPLLTLQFIADHVDPLLHQHLLAC
mmetsp:Transcript_22314/g.76391  ORF Transcript_22314/g.76391 Transcript_22314/m.76391 type:complete len:211 (+) Transcript_22314:6008-6640(+)